MPEIQVSLNDLPQNDFNNIFKSLPEFFDKLRKEKGESLGPCFIAGVPGSFYGRVFPSKSLDFVYSSYSVHWLSQVPEGLENNKGNIYMSNTSPPDVFEAYLKQFQRDFTIFLRSRAEEIKPGGNVVLAFVARSIADPASNDCCSIWNLLVKSLLDMEAEGLVKEADIDSFNVPVYTPYKDEVADIIAEEGSFDLTRLEGFGVNWDASDENEDDKDYVFDKHKSGEIVAKRIRAFSETIVANHFGTSIMDDLYARYAKHISEHLALEGTKHFGTVVSLKRKS
ncbi:hypothetical protein RJ640_015436 [Escallonia rubra]|uniref:Uncharacterized protein n=1 Tax=Escallonia rubra TaxID=112253 RepID=A0AA88ULV6_9ASTE|nr:hypothetical protein RJ640_015436 [Escallonia rubra]